ncbi:MAG TPA: methionyl-tRNA formyltransferase [Pirellulaceae bacterium]|nr:methionyl-tRNA formyltransferase [Pirellulaceae bacterium]
MRLIMMGTGPFAVPTFRALLAGPHEVVALVTRPTPPPVGRRKTPANPMRDLGLEHRLPILEPESVNTPESIAALAAFQPDLLVVCDYGQILTAAAIEVAPLGGINLHASLLPKFRGSAPINWAIYRGEKETGVSVIHITPLLDGGNILSLRKTPIGPRDNAVELEARLAELGIEPVNEAIGQLATWDRVALLGVPQDPVLVTTARRLRKTDAQVNWQRTAVQIARQVRAFQPWPGTYLQWQRGSAAPQRLTLDRVTALAEPATAPPGTVTKSEGQTLWIATRQGTLSVERWQLEGKKALDMGEFLRGYSVAVGTNFDIQSPPAT